VKVNENNELKAKLCATVTQPIIIDKGIFTKSSKTLAKMKFIGRNVKFAWQDVLSELKIDPDVMKIRNY